MATNYRVAAVRAAQEAGIPAELFQRLVGAESGWRANARSPVGAYGLTQLMPATARGLGVNPNDPIQNLRGGARFLAQQYKRFGRWDLALAAYNAGPGAVQKYGGIPPYKETQAYVKKILGGSPLPGPPAGGVEESVATGGQVTDDGSLQALALLARNARATGSGLRNYANATAVGGKFEASPLRGLSQALGRIVPNQTAAPGVDQGGGVETAPGAAPGASGGNIGGGYPTKRGARVIGTPGAGTHTLGNWQSDNAIDVSIPVGTPIFATEDGVIDPQRYGALNSKNPRMAGMRINLKGGRNSYYYAHLSRLVARPGQRVRKGQIIGYSGTANGVPHLHFAVQAGDPRNYYR